MTGVLRYDPRQMGPVINHPILKRLEHATIYAGDFDPSTVDPMRTCRTQLPAILCACGLFLLEAVDARADPKEVE